MEVVSRLGSWGYAPRLRRGSPSGLRAVAQEDHPTAESVLILQVEPEADVGREAPLAATHQDGHEEQVALVDQAGLECLGGQAGATDEEVTPGGRFQPPDHFRVELPQEPGPGGEHGFPGCGKYELVGGLPDRREIQHEGGMGRETGIGLPAGHRLVHAAAIEIGADLSLEVVDEPVHLLVWLSPIELAVLVLDIAVQRGDRAANQITQCALLETGTRSTRSQY